MAFTLESREPLSLINLKPLADYATCIISEQIQATFPTPPRILDILIEGPRNTASFVHSQVLKRCGKRVGVQVDTQVFSESAPIADIQHTINTANCDDQVHGIVFENPPPGFEGCNNLLKHQIHPLKDIDGALGEQGVFTHATAIASLWIANYVLDQTNRNIADLNIGVVGSEGNVGNALLWALSRMGIESLTGYDVKMRGHSIILPWRTVLTPTRHQLWENTCTHDVLFSAASDSLTSLIQHPGVKSGALSS